MKCEYCKKRKAIGKATLTTSWGAKDIISVCRRCKRQLAKPAKGTSIEEQEARAEHQQLAAVWTHDLDY